MVAHLGSFVVFEGLDQSGKSTQTLLLSQYYNVLGIKHIVTREPYNAMIRDLIKNKDILPVTELLLLLADRYEHLYKVIIPNLKNNVHVICDRYYYSTDVYQENIDDMLKETFKKLHCVEPDIVFLLKRDQIVVPRDIMEKRAMGLKYNIASAIIIDNKNIIETHNIVKNIVVNMYR